MQPIANVTFLPDPVFAPTGGPTLANLEAEQALLGAALYDVEAFHAARGLSPAQFYEPVHGRLWEAIGALAADGRQTDPLFVAQRVDTDPGFEALGGRGYLGELVEAAPPPSLAGQYAEMLGDLAARRALVDLGRDLARWAADTSGGGAALDVLAEAEAGLAEIAADGGAAISWVPVGQAVGQAVAAATRASQAVAVAYPTGVAELDALTGGLTAGEMAVIAGRPGMGKSAAGLTVARANAAAGRGTLLFSLEMSEQIVGLRLACDVACDPEAVSYRGQAGFSGETPTLDRARRGVLDDSQWAMLDAAQRAVAAWPLAIDTRPGLTVPMMEACARRKFREWDSQGVPRGPIIVDHLGIVRPDKGRAGNKVMETGDISRALAEMAKRLEVPVVALVQVNRQNETRDDKRPGLADLRWSGAIEEDARLVMFLHRPEHYLRPPEGRETPARRGEREAELAAARHKLFWIVAKQNSGPTGQVETWCDIARSAIRDRRGAAAR